MPNNCPSGASAEHTKKGRGCLANIAAISVKKQQPFVLQLPQSQRATASGQRAAGSGQRILLHSPTGLGLQGCDPQCVRRKTPEITEARINAVTLTLCSHSGHAHLTYVADMYGAFNSTALPRNTTPEIILEKTAL